MSDFHFTPGLDHGLRQGFKMVNHFMVLMWRLGLGTFMRWRWLSGQIMVITHIGRKSGKYYRTPVNFILFNGDVYCTAGFGKVSDWYRNIEQFPEVDVWMPDGWWSGIAEDVSDDDRAPVYLHKILLASGFAAYLFGVNPGRLDDYDLRNLLKTYRLVRIRRIMRHTGRGGPGDLVWLWPLIISLLIIMKKRPDGY